MPGSKKETKLDEILQLLEELAGQIEALETTENFSHFSENGSVDDFIKALIYLKNAKYMASFRLKRLKNIERWFEDAVIAGIEGINKDALPGTNEQLKILEDDKRSLKIGLELRGSSYLIPDENLVHVPEKYRSPVFEINQKALIEDIKLGKAPEWARYDKEKFLVVQPKEII